MRRISKTRQARNKRLTEQYADCHGIPFGEYRFHLPAKVSDWSGVVRVDDATVCAKMHQWFDQCWNCERGGVFWERFTGFVHYKLEAHHVFAGRAGRSDEFTNICMLCNECHGNVNTPELPTGRVLYLLWKWNRQHVDWVRLALLRRSFLPPLILDDGESVDG